MIVKCFENSGVDDCPMCKFCLPRINDPTISGCSMPFVWAGYLDISEAVVEHAVLTKYATSPEPTEPERRGKRRKKKKESK